MIIFKIESLDLDEIALDRGFEAIFISSLLLDKIQPCSQNGNLLYFIRFYREQVYHKFSLFKGKLVISKEFQTRQDNDIGNLPVAHCHPFNKLKHMATVTKLGELVPLSRQPNTECEIVLSLFS